MLGLVRKTFLTLLMFMLPQIGQTALLCQEVFEPILEQGVFDWRASGKNIVRYDFADLPTNRPLHKLASRGAFASKLAYLERQTLGSRKSIWDLQLSIPETLRYSSFVEGITVLSTEVTEARWVVEPICLDSRHSPRGTGHPLARAVIDILSMADSIHEEIPRKVYANVVVWYGMKHMSFGDKLIQLRHPLNEDGSPRIAMIGRLFIDQELSTKEKVSFYREIAIRLQSHRIQEIFIEVADLAHVRLYKKEFGFSVFEILNGEKYGVASIYLMGVSVDEFFSRLFLNQDKNLGN